MSAVTNANSLEKIIDEIVKQQKFKESKVLTSNAKKGGYLSDQNDITIEGKDERGNHKTLNLFLKSIPKEGSLREETPIVDAYYIEINMYTKVFPVLFQFQEEKLVSHPFASIPKCYKTCQLEHDELLIFDNLVKIGYRMWDKTKPMSHECLKKILQEYGRYHALSIALRDQRPEQFERLTDNFSKDVMSEFVELSLEKVVQNFFDAVNALDVQSNEDTIRVLQRYDSTKMHDALKGFPDDNCEETVIIHGDCWCNNFMFLFDGEEDSLKPLKVKFLDWQLSRVASPVLDIAYFFYTNASKQALDYYHDYLKIYHDSLSAALEDLGSDPEKLFSFETLKRHWKKYAHFGLLISCTLFKLCHTHADEIPEIKFERGKGVVDSIIGDGDDITDGFKQRSREVLLHFVQNNLV